jgi:hypothetical protein
MPRILRKLKITEISAVDKPAQAHAKAVLMKRADVDDDDDVDFVSIAKALVTEGLRTSATKEEFETDLAKRAAAAFPDLTPAKAFTKYATETDDGKVLFKAANLSNTVRQQSQDIVPRQKSFGPAGDEVNALIERMIRDGLSLAASYSRVIEDPRHAELVRRYKEENAKASVAVRDSRAPIRNAERLYSRDFRLGHHSQHRLT